LFFWAPIFSVNFEEIRRNVLDPLEVADIQILTLKSLVFGLTMVVVACYKGLNVKRDIRDLPRASSQAVVSSIIAIFLLDVLISLMVLL
jgi:phospholipid/cholesterol/gamma-HCH transport system permease protein